jgi:hypothetical protein
MPEYGTCECFACYRRIPKPEAHRISIEREKGHSSGSYRFSRRSTSYYTGRTYYAKQDVWLCSNCYSAYIARQKRRNRMTVGLICATVIGIVVVNQDVTNNGTSTLQPIQTGNRASAVQEGDQTASLAHVEEASPREPIIVQNRLIELGYLGGAADGVWGPRSRGALRGFKAANGLPADDKWDEAINRRLLSASAARSPAPLAAGPR